MIAENIETLMVAARVTGPRFFQFENDFVGALKCIPMIVRYKLDTCRVKLKLEDWVKMSYPEKDNLAQMPCYLPVEIEKYAGYVNSIAFKRSGAYPSILANINDKWTSLSEVPEEIHAKSDDWECPRISLRQWQSLDLLERFALIKLSRSGHEGKNFPAAIREFLY